MRQKEEIKNNTEPVKKLPLIKTIIYYTGERLKDTLDTFQIRRYIRTKWGRKKIINMKIETKQKYKIEGQEEYYDEIIQEHDQENIKVRNGDEWKILGPDLKVLITIEIPDNINSNSAGDTTSDPTKNIKNNPTNNTKGNSTNNTKKIKRENNIDATPYEGKYIITMQGKKTIIDSNGNHILTTENGNNLEQQYYSDIEARNLGEELGTVFIAWNINENGNKMDNKTGEIKDHTETTISNENGNKMSNKSGEIKESTETTILNEDGKEMAKKTGEIKDFKETTIFNNEGKKILGPINIIHINNKPVIDTIEGGLLVKTDSGRIITQDNENPITLEDIILRYINKKPTIIGYKKNGKRHKKEKARYFTPKEIEGNNNAA